MDTAAFIADVSMRADMPQTASQFTGPGTQAAAAAREAATAVHLDDARLQQLRAQLAAAQQVMQQGEYNQSTLLSVHVGTRAAYS